MILRIHQWATLTVALWAGLCQPSPTSHASPAEIRAESSLNSLARDVERVEAIREVKDLQRTLSHLVGFGKWKESAALFSDNAVLQWGNATVEGLRKIEEWLKADAGNMDGVNSGSLNLLLAESPLINLSGDGQSALGRWNGLRFQGDGANQTRIQGGIYENKYILDGERWKISLLKYHAMYDGQYVGGWRNVGGPLPIVPYHFSPETTGVHIPPAVGEAPPTTSTLQHIARRVGRMEDEDEVRNLQHIYGYYVDRRMWTDVADMFSTNSSANIEGLGKFAQADGVRQAHEQYMGPEGLKEGILNDHMILSTIVGVDPSGDEAIARSIGVAMIGDTTTRSASWEFSIYRNTFVKDKGTGIWKFKDLNITPLVTADYQLGWGNGGIRPRKAGLEPPPFVWVGHRRSVVFGFNMTKSVNVTDIHAKLARASAYDGAENMSNAYGYYLDDLRCDSMGTIHADKGHKLSPFAGWYFTPRRIAEACVAAYGNRTDPMRTSLSYHWRPQPVIQTSADGRSAAVRTRLFQPSTNINSSGAFNGAIYHDQMVLEQGRWKIWDITIDEFYWTSAGWEKGWAFADKRPASEPDQPPPRLGSFPPDLTLLEVGEREATFRGGSGRYLAWPEIQRMWFSYRNPVSGRIPDSYWPGCVPCKARPDWSLLSNGYQEPATGPTALRVSIHKVSVEANPVITITIVGGPAEPVSGVVELYDERGDIRGSAVVTNGSATLAQPTFPPGEHIVSAHYLGSDRLRPARESFKVTIS